ncbi:DAK2 domain-containing protein [Nocardioides jishulii]|uniref:DAK2 domain-containing protein n=1 Tax=Nocardioides jishulii TaxID=2575440 RepID=A0A4U2YLQ2_9ACTN|nr:DAK2 domain-containing protein [Nocardioides jishulii]QCX27033.1 DAK2 domain-containing protein [Nocardioides jishulii]TKI61515.1 DAK2 domain-containing protein [Nocardioides jishulii]
MEQVPNGIRLATVLRFVDVATDALSAAREEIDALNVYPVPDGDTGTNMFLTFSAARDAVREASEGGNDLVAGLAAFRRAALLSARGNSGVILSQMLGALAHRLERAAPGEETAHVMADAMRLATEASYEAVAVPVEGTILTVARAASDRAVALVRDAEGPVTPSELFTAAAAAAREALALTPTQLKVLADAGVVDAGGRGLCVVLDAAERVLTGRHPVSEPGHHKTPRIPVRVPEDELSEGGPSYEVMFLLDAADEAAVGVLRSELAALGDSLVVVGGEDLWNVHVHVDDVGAAIEAGIRAGRPHRIRVTHFAEQVAEHRHRDASLTGRKVVAVTFGDGLRDLFAAAGALVVEAGVGRRPSTGEILAAIEESGAAEVVVMPNDPDSLRVAEIAARTAEDGGQVRVAVIPTQAQVQGLAAIAVHEPGRSFEQDVLEMTATARHARHGAVTVAARQAFTTAGPCEVGDVLGVIEGDFAIIGSDLFEVASGVVGRLLGAGGELVTLVSGCDEHAAALAERCAAWVEETYPLADVVVYEGGQERYPLLMSVE